MLQYFFNDIKNFLRRWVLTPAIVLWRFKSPLGFQLPTWSSLGSVKVHFLTLFGILGSMWCDFWVFLLARNLATPYFGRKPRARVVRIMDMCYSFVQLNVCVMEIQLNELWRLPLFREETSHLMVKFPLETVCIVPTLRSISINFCSNKRESQRNVIPSNVLLELFSITFLARKQSLQWFKGRRKRWKSNFPTYVTIRKMWIHLQWSDCVLFQKVESSAILVHCRHWLEYVT
jgi:hypothetical protein